MERAGAATGAHWPDGDGGVGQRRESVSGAVQRRLVVRAGGSPTDGQTGGQERGESRGRGAERRTESRPIGASSDRRAFRGSARDRRDNGTIGRNRKFANRVCVRLCYRASVFWRIERDRAADQPAEERGEEDAASRAGKERGVSGRHRVAVSLRSHLPRDLCPPRGSRGSANGERAPCFH